MFHESISSRVQRLGIKRGEFAALIGISAPKFSNFLRGRASLDNPEKLLSTLSELEELKSFFPIPLGLHDAKLLAVALERHREGRFEAFRELTRSTDWSISHEENERLKRHYPKLMKED